MKGCFTIRDPITETVKHYVTDKKQIEQAILIKGNWGSGKTYYWKNILSRALEKDTQLDAKDIKYLSLFGIDSVDELKASIFYAFASKEMDQKEVVNQSLNNMRIAAMRYFRLTEEQMKIDPSKFVDINNKVLCIDDLERTKFGIVNVLGLLDQLLVENRIKIIILGHEGQIDSDKEEEYNDYKEKVIGKTIQIKQSAETIINDFIEEYNTSNTNKKEVVDNIYYADLLKMKENIITFMEDAGLDNYRVLRQSLSDAYTIFKNIEHTNLSKLSYQNRESIIASTIWLSFLQKRNDINFNKIEEGSSYHTIINEIDKQLKNKNNKMIMSRKYLYSNISTLGFSFSSFHLIAYGKLHLDMIKDEIENWISEPYQHEDFEQRITCFEDLTDEEIIKTVQEVKDKLKKGNITLKQVRYSFVFFRGLLQIEFFSEVDSEECLLEYFKQSLRKLSPEVFQDYAVLSLESNDSTLMELNAEIRKVKKEKEKEYHMQKSQEWRDKIQYNHKNIIDWVDNYSITRELELEPHALASAIFNDRDANSLARVQSAIIHTIENSINTQAQNEKEIEWWKCFYENLKQTLSNSPKNKNYSFLIRMNFFIEVMEEKFNQYGLIKKHS